MTSEFWDDLDVWVQDPEFRVAYVQASDRIARTTPGEPFWPWDEGYDDIPDDTATVTTTATPPAPTAGSTP